MYGTVNARVCTRERETRTKPHKNVNRETNAYVIELSPSVALRLYVFVLLLFLFFSSSHENPDDSSVQCTGQGKSLLRRNTICAESTTNGSRNHISATNCGTHKMLYSKIISHDICFYYSTLIYLQSRAVDGTTAKRTHSSHSSSFQRLHKLCV